MGRMHDELKASAHRSYDELRQHLRDLTLRVELVKKAQLAHPDITTIRKETTNMFKKMNDYVINKAIRIRAIHQGIHMIESKIGALLLLLTSITSSFTSISAYSSQTITRFYNATGTGFPSTTLRPTSRTRTKGASSSSALVVEFPDDD